MLKMDGSGAPWSVRSVWSVVARAVAAIACDLKKHWKSALFVVVAFSVFAMLWMWFLFGEDTIPTMRPWLETLNGATWSDRWEEKWCTDRFWFAGAVAVRTTINFAGPIGGLVALVWFFFGGLERYMMTQLGLLRVHNAELLPTLLEILRKGDIEVPEELKNKMKAAAEGVAEDLYKDVTKPTQG